MKKSCYIFLLVFITVTAVLSCNASDLYQSFPYQSYCINDTKQNRPSLLKERPAKHPGKVEHADESTIGSKKNQSCDMITSRNTSNFFDYPVSGIDGRADDMIVNQQVGVGVVLVRLYFEFTKFSGKKLAKSHTISVSQKTGR